MSRILFVMLHPGFIRYYEGAVRGLADAGHDVHVAFEISRDKLGENALAAKLAASSPRITCGTTPPRSESVREFLVRADRSATRGGDAWKPVTGPEAREQSLDSLATTVRLMLDYLRFFEPAFAHADKLRDRAAKRLPQVYGPIVRAAGRAGAPGRAVLAGTLRTLEAAIPTSPAIDAFIREQRPDLLLVTPLIELGSQQVDYVKSARRLGVRSALAVASWDNLTSKGLVRVVPDHVIVWNDAQKREATSLHAVPADRVVVTGAQLFDRWFEARPTHSREGFCRRVGLDPERPFVLYVGSSTFIAPDEVPFAERWIARLRGSSDPQVATAGVLIRPHPTNARQWRALDRAAWPNLAVWPPIGSDPNAADFHADFFDSIHHSAAVVGINTSAQIEAGIIGRPVFTIRVPEFEHSQAGTLHFQHLVDPSAGVVQEAGTLEEHLGQLGRALRGEHDVEPARRFVRSFIRPHGVDTAATPVFVAAVASLAQLPAPPPQPARWTTSAAQPAVRAVAAIARALAEDRPLWVYALRPLVTTTVWAWALTYRARAAGRSTALAIRREGRRARRAWYESSQRAGKVARRLHKRVGARVRSAGVALKQIARRVGVLPAAGRKNA